MGLVGRYTVKPSPLNEEELQIELANKNFSPQEYARTLAERKAHAMGVLMGTAMPNSGEVTIIIGSDTIVDLDGTISEFIGGCLPLCSYSVIYPSALISLTFTLSQQSKWKSQKMREMLSTCFVDSVGMCIKYTLELLPMLLVRVCKTTRS